MRGLFTDKELDDIEARYKSAECDLIDALKHQVNMLQDRVDELEQTFRYDKTKNTSAP